MRKNSLLPALLIFAALCLGAVAADNVVAVSSLAELAQAAARNDQRISMKPGVYRLIDHIPLEAIPERRKRKEYQFIVFSGSNNAYALDGVTIEVDTRLRAALRPPVHTNEFVLSGDNNSLTGLTITNIGDGASPGGAALSISGKGNTLRDCTLRVRGSFPYGYGDLFGKGGPGIISHQKHSGLLITGSDTRLIGCKIYMQSFGHGFFVQKDAANVSFEDCYVKGEVRSTDEMLQENSGPAFKVGFRTVAKNRNGENKVTPGYTKSLAEDGFRTYGQHKNLSFKNCTAQNMRGGFELRSKTGVRLENCTAIGNERGFWISDNATLINCKGDSQYGPLLFAEGNGASVELTLLPTAPTSKVHALATLQGSGHRVAVKSATGKNPPSPAPILIGYGTPMMGEGMASIPERTAKGLVLRNETIAPVVIGAMANDCEITSQGPVSENYGRNITIKAFE